MWYTFQKKNRLLRQNSGMFINKDFKNNHIWILSHTSMCWYFKQWNPSAFLNTYLFKMI